MLAVIEIGGKQYLVSEGQTLSVDKLSGEAGSSITFDRVLLRTDGQSVAVGQPYVAGASVQAKIVRQYRGPKTIVLKYKPKVRYRKKFGHRQATTDVQITAIR